MKNKQGNRYAYNINDIKRTKQFKGSLIDFKTLNRGTYDEIENIDNSIKNSGEKLKNIKNRTIKELVYTNKNIPDQWKNKLDYKPNLLKIFIKDTDFLAYLGSGGNGSKANKIQKVNNKLISKLSKTNDEDKINSEKDIKKDKEPEKILNPHVMPSSKSLTKLGKLKDKQNYTDKEVIGILEEFKTAYPIILKEKEIKEISTPKNDKVNEAKKVKTFYSIDNNKKRDNNLSSLPSLVYKNKKRQITFKQNIYTNLIPNKQYRKKKLEGYKSFTGFYPKNNSLSDKNIMFLNSNNEFFDKKIHISNPIIFKNLEGINFYGPYFSYCPACGNKNLEFYKNLEQNQCLKIIHQIKKIKGKNIILNDDKDNKNKNPINKKFLDNPDNASLKLMNRSVKNNFSDSMHQQFSNNSSNKDYSNEKQDIVF